jgi:isoleucyl-tRNA synthetase
VLERWEKGRVFERSLEQTAGGEPWVFYEGPPTANGKPGTHHVEAAVFKDLFPRFKTMQGRHVPRKAGWDCHGLPVELAVEKELGFSGKQDIEAYGVAEFNAKCRESVLRHVDEFERMTARMGYWCDMATPTGRWTPPTSSRSGGRSSRSPTRACWSRTTASRRTARAAAPAVRPRGRAGLPDRSSTQRLRPLPGHQRPLQALGAALLVWTTTPWTLVSQHASPSTPASLRRGPAGDEVPRRSPSRCSGVLARTPRCSSASRAPRWSTRPYARPFDWVEIPARTTSAWPTT